MHNGTSPGLLLRHVSPQVDHVTVADIVSDGIVIDTPMSSLTLQHTKVTGCISGIVLKNSEHESIRLNNVSAIDNFRYGLTTSEVQQISDLPDSLFGVTPVCAGVEDEQIIIEKYSEILLYQSRYRQCNVVVKPQRNETIVLDVIRLRPKNYNYYPSNCLIFANIEIFDTNTSESLGKLHCNDRVGHLHIISPSGGVRLRVSSDQYDDYSYYQLSSYFTPYADLYDEYFEFDNEEIGSEYFLRIMSTNAEGKCFIQHLY